MTDKSYWLGRVVWREAVTKDLAKAKAFYGGLFGWAFKDMDMGPMGTYGLVQVGEKQIGGMMKQPPEMAAIPAHWMSYVAVTDVDASAAAAKSGGGQVPWGPTDIPNVGRMATVLGFDGAALSVMKPTGPEQAPPTGRPNVGEFCWETLTTADVDRAKKFWTAVIPAWKTFTGGGMPTFGVAEGMEGQVADIQAAKGPVPANWLTFVVVTKLETTTEKVAKLGGRVMMPGIEIPNIGRIAVIVDDQGAAIGLFEPNMG